MIRTVIVEDDFRVAEIHGAYVLNIPGFEVIGTAHTAAHAFEIVVEMKPDLVLLDLHLPDEHGLSLFARFQQLPAGSKPDVFIISAARDVASVREALQLGSTQYIMKPFNQKELAERMIGYRLAREKLLDSEEISQDEIDRLSALMRGPRIGKPSPEHPKSPTTSLILKFIEGRKASVSALEVAEELGLSRATAQRYLSHMVENGYLDLNLQYGTTGRPVHLFTLS
jgi:response regulator of citrate/malate metabolism